MLHENAKKKISKKKKTYFPMRLDCRIENWQEKMAYLAESPDYYLLIIKHMNTAQMEILFRAMKPVQLAKLTFHESNIAGFPNTFSQCINLEELWAPNIGLKALPEGFGNLTALRTIRLDHNKLANIPYGFGRLFPTPVRLDPKYIDPELGNIEPWQNFFRESELTLDLSHNRLTSLPSDFGEMVGLEELDLSQNQLTTLPTNFGNLARLRKLDLNHNQLRDLPPSFAQFRALRWIDFNFNAFKHFPQQLEAIPMPGLIRFQDNPVSVVDISNWHFYETVVHLPYSCHCTIDWWR
ncbi:MAG: leucine-rich repeat domain-containing protein, partial [Promethearchaeota archaeon]